MSPLTIEEPIEQAGSWDAPAAGPVLFRMKYVRHRRFGFVLFEGAIRHDDMAQRLGNPDDVISAGFVFSPGAELKCLGYSETLRVGCGPNDAADLRQRMLAF